MSQQGSDLVALPAAAVTLPPSLPQTQRGCVASIVGLLQAIPGTTLEVCKPSIPKVLPPLPVPSSHSPEDHWAPG